VPWQHPGPLFSIAGHKARSVVDLMGDPTVAEAMYRHDPGIMLYAPLRTVLYEDVDCGVHFAIDQASQQSAASAIPISPPPAGSSTRSWPPSSPRWASPCAAASADQRPPAPFDSALPAQPGSHGAGPTGAGRCTCPNRTSERTRAPSRAADYLSRGCRQAAVNLVLGINQKVNYV
jgi:hypothetical protein